MITFDNSDEMKEPKQIELKENDWNQIKEGME
jgi:hypothetical protein